MNDLDANIIILSKAILSEYKLDLLNRIASKYNLQLSRGDLAAVLDAIVQEHHIRGWRSYTQFKDYFGGLSFKEVRVLVAEAHPELFV